MCCRQTSPEAKGDVAHTTGHAACCYCFGPVRMALVFLSMPSARRATWHLRPSRCRLLNFYPRPPRGGRQSTYFKKGRFDDISIHALREEGDVAFAIPMSTPAIFLSTPSVRRATRMCAVRFNPEAVFLSTPSARRATSYNLRKSGRYLISIHALREEGDFASFSTSSVRSSFLSTPSARRATRSAPA